MGAFDRKKIPILDLRLESNKNSADLEARSNVDHTESLIKQSPTLSEDWELQIRPETALGWIRRKAFKKGVVTYGVALDPRAFSMKDNLFKLSLRLWKIEGTGKWWRDYEVNGKSSVQNNRIKIVGKDVAEGEKSSGAELADPLALLVEGRILDGIADNLNHVIPAKKSTSIGKQTLSSQLKSLTGNDDMIVARGSFLLKNSTKK